MTDSVLTYLDGYCERAGELGAFAEPINLVTNLFFMLAAVLVARTLRHRPGESRDLWLLTAVLFGIGVGSGLWHLKPSGTTLLLDVVPITLFINIYMIAALRRLFGLSWVKTVAWWGFYFAMGLVAQYTLPPDLLNGTIMYIPTYLALIVMTAGLWRRNRTDGAAFMLALLVWSASLAFRTVDMAVCPTLSIGTHFLWHTLNAWVLWRLLMVLVGSSGQNSRA